ncbi:MAG: hypothetical protein LQ340_005493 [Diploschistes diacapsis]|nr:MAG: hypothetical protein LQ340_005493 [Diploschistes diacapsis]
MQERCSQQEFPSSRAGASIEQKTRETLSQPSLLRTSYNNEGRPSNEDGSELGSLKPGDQKRIVRRHNTHQRRENGKRSSPPDPPPPPRYPSPPRYPGFPHPPNYDIPLKLDTIYRAPRAPRLPAPPREAPVPLGFHPGSRPGNPRGTAKVFSQVAQYINNDYEKKNLAREKANESAKTAKETMMQAIKLKSPENMQQTFRRIHNTESEAAFQKYKQREDAKDAKRGMSNFLKTVAPGKPRRSLTPPNASRPPSADKSHALFRPSPDRQQAVVSKGPVSEIAVAKNQHYGQPRRWRKSKFEY